MAPTPIAANAIPEKSPSFDLAAAHYHRCRSDQAHYYGSTLDPLIDAHEACAPDTAEAAIALCRLRDAEEAFSVLVDATDEAAVALFAAPAGTRSHIAHKLHVALIEGLFEGQHEELLFHLLADVRGLDAGGRAA